MTLSFKTFVTSTLVVLATVTTFNAIAQTPATPASSPRPHAKGMKVIDANKDKLISRDEAKGKPKLEKHFDAIDSNKDGQLSREEIIAYRKAHKGEHKGEGRGQTKP